MDSISSPRSAGAELLAALWVHEPPAKIGRLSHEATPLAGTRGSGERLLVPILPAVRRGAQIRARPERRLHAGDLLSRPLQ